MTRRTARTVTVAEWRRSDFRVALDDMEATMMPLFEVAELQQQGKGTDSHLPMEDWVAVLLINISSEWSTFTAACETWAVTGTCDYPNSPNPEEMFIHFAHHWSGLFTLHGFYLPSEIPTGWKRGDHDPISSCVSAQIGLVEHYITSWQAAIEREATAFHARRSA